MENFNELLQHFLAGELEDLPTLEQVVEVDYDTDWRGAFDTRLTTQFN